MIQPQFEQLGSSSAFKDDSIPVKRGSKWGYIDRTGKFFIQPRFDKAEPFSKGVARVQEGSGNFASDCINKLGESVDCP